MTLASASLEKLPVHSTKVDPACSPLVTGKRRMVERTLVYVSAGVEEMTE
jgi:hypothetical protein